VADILSGIDDHGLILLNEEGRKLAEHRLAEIAALLECVGGAYEKESKRVASDESLEQRLIHAREILANFHQRILRLRAHLERNFVRSPVEIEQHGLLLPLREHAGEVHGERCCADAAFGADERVDLAELASSCGDAARGGLEALHRVAEFSALEREW